MEKMHVLCANRKDVQTILSVMESLDFNWKIILSKLRFNNELKAVEEELLRQIDDAAKTCSGDGSPARILNIDVEDKSITMITPAMVIIKVYKDESPTPTRMSSTLSGTRVYGLPDKLDGWSISIKFGRDSKFLARQLIARAQLLGYEVTWGKEILRTNKLVISPKEEEITDNSFLLTILDVLSDHYGSLAFSQEDWKQIFPKIEDNSLDEMRLGTIVALEEVRKEQQGDNYMCSDFSISLGNSHLRQPPTGITVDIVTPSGTSINLCSDKVEINFMRMSEYACSSLRDCLPTSLLVEYKEEDY